MNKHTKEVMTAQAAIARSDAMKLEERKHLKAASRARRAADKAYFFDDEVEFHDHLTEERMHYASATMCAAEAHDLLTNFINESAGGSL